MFSFTSVIILLPALASAHFKLNWPSARGFDEDKLPEYPCGSFDRVSSKRTAFPLSGGPLQLDFEHTQSNIEVLIAVGDDPSGDDYHTVLVPTFLERGPGQFCIGAITGFPDSLNVSEGQNATLLVQTNGDPDGGLYQCADITFTSDALSSSEYSSHCKNNSGSKIFALKGSRNANETEAGTDIASQISQGASSSTSSGLGARKTANVINAGLGALAIVGLAAL